MEFAAYLVGFYVRTMRRHAIVNDCTTQDPGETHQPLPEIFNSLVLYIGENFDPFAYEWVN